MDEMTPVGELYFSNDLYGEDMKQLRNALQEKGFDLHIDPLADQAELVKSADDYE